MGIVTAAGGVWQNTCSTQVVGPKTVCALRKPEDSPDLVTLARDATREQFHSSDLRKKLYGEKKYTPFR